MELLSERLSKFGGAAFLLKPPFPRNRMLLEVTNICNHDCIFCGHHKMTRKAGMMSLEFAKRILREAYDLGMREVGFYTVGEAFVHKDIALFVKEAKNIGYTYTYITTNGALATPERVVPVIEAGLDSIKFSINAGTPESYAFIHGRDDFNVVKENLQFISDYRKKGYSYKIFVSSVLTKYTENAEQLIKQQFLKLCDEIVFVPVVNVSVTNPENNTLLKCEERPVGVSRLCDYPFNSVNISWEGYLTACCQDFNNAVAVSNLNEVSLEEAWHCDAFTQLRQDIIESKDATHLCGRCIKKSIGAVGCMESKLGSDIMLETILDDSQVRQRIINYTL